MTQTYDIFSNFNKILYYFINKFYINVRLLEVNHSPGLMYIIRSETDCIKNEIYCLLFWKSDKGGLVN
jgi:hypothetical protein